MGKAARSKRERREAAQDPLRTATAAAARTEHRSIPVFWIIVAAIVIGGIAALVVTAPDDSDRAAQQAGEAAPVFASVETTTALAEFPGNDRTDPAVGTRLPTLAGTGIDGKPLRYIPGDGAQVVVVFAHWCPHCNAELPKIVEWAKQPGNLPDHVFLRGVSTAASEQQPNFPPAEWLAKEDWTWSTLVDDEAGTAADALGVDGFPFLVFVDSHGKVMERFSGEMPIGDFAKSVRSLGHEPA